MMIRNAARTGLQTLSSIPLQEGKAAQSVVSSSNKSRETAVSTAPKSTDKLVYLKIDDIDRHGEGCQCGLCNGIGKSFGAGIYKVLEPDEPIERLYAASDESAIQNARQISGRKGYQIVEYDEGYITGKVRLSLDDIIGFNQEQINDLLSHELTGTDLLMDIGYELIGCEGHEMLIRVTGSVEGIRDVFAGRI
jgi:hypothetical protein